MKKLLETLRSWLRSLLGGHNKKPVGQLPRYSFLKKRILKQLEDGPKSAYVIDRLLREEGFRTSKVILTALYELVEEGQVVARARAGGRSSLYEKVGSTLNT